jgi:hypothetical protein
MSLRRSPSKRVAFPARVAIVTPLISMNAGEAIMPMIVSRSAVASGTPDHGATIWKPKWESATNHIDAPRVASMTRSRRAACAEGGIVWDSAPNQATRRA